MSANIVVEPLRGPGLLLLDVATGQLRPAPAQARKQGNLAQAEGHTFALYADAGVLYFQWDDHRWPILSPDVRVRYAHDLARKTTTFAVNDRVLEYPAWWRDDPQFEPLHPEADEDFDPLGYYAALKREPERLERLLRRWSGAA
jgi:hypothetical protein